jgi:hypothetical protein
LFAGWDGAATRVSAVPSLVLQLSGSPTLDPTKQGPVGSPSPSQLPCLTELEVEPSSPSIVTL